MTTRPAFKRALGIATGDIVRTSYGTGPYEVWDIWGPHRFIANPTEITIWAHPVIFLSMVALTETGEPIVPRGNDGFYGINEIRQEGDRWFNFSGEVFVTPGSSSVQASLFDQGPDAPKYPLQEGVNYQHDRVWHCPQCGRDFDDSQLPEPPIEVTTYSKLVYGSGQRVRPDCPSCGDWPIPILWVGTDTNSFLMRNHR